MPDGDRIHIRLAPIYQKVYKQLCEGQYRDEELAIEALRSLKKDIQKYGDGPIKVIEQVAIQLKRIPSGPLLKEMVDWCEESMKIDKLMQQVNSSKRAINWATQACKEQLDELRYDECLHNFLFEITEKYLRNVYIANFEKRTPLKRHYKGVNQTTVDTRLDCMRPHVIKGIVVLTMQIVQKGSVDTLRLPRHSRGNQAITIDTDLSLIAV